MNSTSSLATGWPQKLGCEAKLRVQFAPGGQYLQVTLRWIWKPMLNPLRILYVPAAQALQVNVNVVILAKCKGAGSFSQCVKLLKSSLLPCEHSTIEELSIRTWLGPRTMSIKWTSTKGSDVKELPEMFSIPELVELRMPLNGTSLPQISFFFNVWRKLVLMISTAAEPSITLRCEPLTNPKLFVKMFPMSATLPFCSVKVLSDMPQLLVNSEFTMLTTLWGCCPVVALVSHASPRGLIKFRWRNEVEVWVIGKSEIPSRSESRLDEEASFPVSLLPTEELDNICTFTTERSQVLPSNLHPLIFNTLLTSLNMNKWINGRFVGPTRRQLLSIKVTFCKVYSEAWL